MWEGAVSQHRDDAPDWLNAAVSEFGDACKSKLSGPGEREALIRSPLEAFIRAVGDRFGLSVAPQDEVRDEDRAVRPDYAIKVNGVITGYVEVKAPGVSVDTATYSSGHNKTQWDRLRDVPNLLYSNGIEWWLYRDGEPHRRAVLDGLGLAGAGSSLAPDREIEGLLRDFLFWKPMPITAVAPLVRAVAPLTRLLRAEVRDQLEVEARRVAQGADQGDQPFRGLAQEWKRLLFPDADDPTFANGYAQAVTFALLLAKAEGITLTENLASIGDALGQAHHGLLGRALELLTKDVAAEFKVTINLLIRVVDAVDWQRIVDRQQRSAIARNDPYLHLYEHFLAEYDPEWRKLSGSYYTPLDVVTAMVNLADEVLRSHLGKPTGFADPLVTTVDPAMGTGTFVNTVLDKVADTVRTNEGQGAVPGALTNLAKRLIGFELQMGPYAVAEMRTGGELKAAGASLPGDGLRLYVTNTLDDPADDQQQISSFAQPIAVSRRRANKVKRETPVTVVIGNPPYAENASDLGRWIEDGCPAAGLPSPMRAFRTPGDGVYVQNLKNLYVYFWRWATWKVFDNPPNDEPNRAGVVCYISTSGYLVGPGFRGMREYLRRNCSAGWVIDLTPEGQTPPVPTRVFPGVRQPLAIGIFVRTENPDPETPADIKYRAVHGRQQAKFDALNVMTLTDDAWLAARTDWQAPFTAAAEGSWDDFPAMGDLFVWTSPGIAANRTWVIAPDEEILAERWRTLIAERNEDTKRTLLRETPSTTLDATKTPLPGLDTEQGTGTALKDEAKLSPATARIGYRSFDRQHVIADPRVWHRPRPPLWAARIAGQVFCFEQHAHRVGSGPGLVFSALIPDMDYFKGSEGGRVLPLLHPGGRSNFAAGLLSALSTLVAPEWGGSVTGSDFLAYVAAVVAHPAFTARFSDELVTPGIRVPITAEPDLFNEAVKLGRAVLWLHTYGAQYDDEDDSRHHHDIRYPANDPRRIASTASMTTMPIPEDPRYDEATNTVIVGTGMWAPVEPAVLAYEVGGKNIVKSWLNYREADPGGRRSSPLDDMNVQTWPSEWTAEFTDLLTVLSRLIDLEPAQAELLDKVLAGPLLTRDTLVEHEVVWPPPTQRRPDYNTVSSPEAEGGADGALW
ncbi:MAG: type ISP restriction/modification enzyme [Jatrophihabitantaceae bacterium]